MADVLPKRDSCITNRLRFSKQFPLIFTKTNKFKNLFTCFGLAHYQLSASSGVDPGDWVRGAEYVMTPKNVTFFH